MPFGGRQEEVRSSTQSQSDDATLNDARNSLANPPASADDSSSNEKERPKHIRSKTGADGRRELTEDDAPEELGFAFSSLKKW